MRLLLTGASGFLGRHVAAAACDHTLVRVTRAARATGPDEVALEASPWTSATLAGLLDRVRPDVVLHCAGTTESGDLQALFAANTILAAELLQATASVASPPRVVLVGSAAEYGVGAPAEQPVSETYACVPTTAYGISKYAQTLAGQAACARGLSVLTVRLFNPVGVGMPEHLALPSFARQIARCRAGGTLRVGDLSAERDFIDVAEAARIIVGFAEMPEWPWPVVNLCSGRAWRIGDLLGQMIAISGKDLPIEIDPAALRPQTPSTLVGSIARLESVGLAPKPLDFTVLLPRVLDHATLLAHQA